jgi:hypothetical protein
MGIVVCQVGVTDATSSEPRRPANDDELRTWLENMIWYHRYTVEEITAATGLAAAEIGRAVMRLGISPETQPARRGEAPLLVLPYPGGRHPRIGFLEGAQNPQRETKVSIFTPWDQASYVVVDVPEAVWSNLGLMYLAHTHVPTIWTKQKIELEKLEWQRRASGALSVTRNLPNHVTIQTEVTPEKDCVRMDLRLVNGTNQPLTNLRVQVCVLLKGAATFNEQTNENKVFMKPYAACAAHDRRRWIIVAWEPCHSVWAQPKCPCLHSDPIFPDCPPGETRHVHGRVWFYDGPNVHAEFRRLDESGWRKELGGGS